MIAFLIICTAIVLWIQQWILENSPDFVEAIFWPDENVVDPDESFNIILELKNKRAFPLYFIRINMTFDKNFHIDPQIKRVEKKYGTEDCTVSFSTWLKANQTIQLRIPISISNRGRYILQNPTLMFGDFLGLKETRKELDLFREVVVAPRDYSSDDVKQVLGKYLGEYSVRRFIFEDPILTVGFRDYTGREPMKMISWKQSAQRQKLMVKEFDHTIEPVVSILVNTDTQNETPSLEKVFSIARSVCSNLESKGIPYDFFTNAQIIGRTDFSPNISEGLGARHFSKVMELLGRSMLNSAFSNTELFHLAHRSSKTERGFIVITPDTSSLGNIISDQQTLILNASTL